MKNAVVLRPETPDDEYFIYQVYSSTRTEELSVLDWDDNQKEAFMQMQFKAQTTHYRKYYHDAQFLIIVYNGKMVGRLYVLRLPGEIRIVDIAILPEARNKGIGAHLLTELLDEGRKKGLPVSIHVEHVNRAINLYKRLGFEIKEDTGVYYLMHWNPTK